MSNVVPLQQPQQTQQQDPITDIFQHWQVIQQKPRARLDIARRKIIQARLNDGYSVADLQDAINGCYLDPFYQGDNDRNKAFNDISLILRDAAHVDQFIETYEQAQAKSGRLHQAAKTEKEPKATAEKVREALDTMKRMFRR